MISSFRSSAISPAFATIAWGVFCTCSWTWVIGMFLPAILLQRYGWAGFGVFAFFNVIGCAGFGYVLRTRAPSAQLVRVHAPMMLVFSSAAVGYHLLFASIFAADWWEIVRYARPLAFVEPSAGAQPWLMMVLLPGAIFFIGAVLSRLRDRAWLVLAMLIYAASIITLIALIAQPTRLDALPMVIDTPGLMLLAPIIAGGFLLCPYLDLTFHRALQRSPSRHAFFIFGMTFFFMLVLTCVLWFRDSSALWWLACGHLALQGVFTVGAHLRELREHRTMNRGSVLFHAVLLALPWLFVGLFLIIRSAAPTLSEGDATYLRYLGWYGLVFPLYVLMFMLTAKRRNHWVTFITTILILAPIFELGFLHDREWLFAIPAVAAAAWLAWPRKGPPDTFGGSRS